MRKLALAAAAATILAGTVPASAQSFYGGWGYGDWSRWGHSPNTFGYGPGDGSSYGGRFYGGPAVNAYAYADGPRYRTRRVVRTTRATRSYDPGFSAYAYSPYSGGYGYGAPYAGTGFGVTAGVGFGPSWGYRWW